MTEQLALSQDGKRLVVVGAGRLQIWDTASGILLTTLPGHTDIGHVILNATDNTILAFRFRSPALLIDANNGSVIRSILDAPQSPQKDPQLIGFGPKQGTLWTAVFHQTEKDFHPRTTSVALVDEATGKTLRGLPPFAGWLLNMDRAGGLAATISGTPILHDGIMKDMSNIVFDVYDLVTGKELSRLSGMQGAPIATAFSWDGTYFAAAPWSGGTNDDIVVWNTRTGERLPPLAGHKGHVAALAFLRDGRLVSGGLDATVRLWNVPEAKLLRTIRHSGERVDTLAVAPDGRTLYSCSAMMDGAKPEGVQVWNLDTGKRIGTLTPKLSAVEPSAIAMSLDGQWLAVDIRGEGAQLWNLREGRRAQTFSTAPAPQQAFLSGIAFSPDGSVLAGAVQNNGGTNDDTVFVWSTADGRELAKLARHKGMVNDLAFTADGTLMVSGSNDGNMHFWNCRTWALEKTIATETGAVSSVVCTPDGARVASVAVEWETVPGIGDVPKRYILSLHDLARNEVLYRVQVTNGSLSHLAVSPDGHWLTYNETVLQNVRGTAIVVVDLRALKETARITEGLRESGWVHRPYFTSDSSRLVVGLGGIAQKPLLLFDVPTGSRLKMVSPPGIAFLRDYAQGRAGARMALVSFDGSILLCDSRDFAAMGRLASLATLRLFSGNKWLVTTPQNYYDYGPDDVAEALAWREGGQVRPVSRFAETYHRQGILRHALRGQEGADRR
jgi:WD40 repeat protein